jgi:uncharacterized protein (TIRG00374 family)
LAEQHQESAREAASLRRKFLSPQTVVSFALLGTLLWFLTTRFDIAWGDTWDTVRTMNPAWYAAAVVIHYMTFVFRGARWRVLLMNVARHDDPPSPPPSVAFAGRVILMSWFANSVAFFRMGDAYRAYAYAEDAGVSFPRTAGTVLADRLIDTAVVIVLMGVGIVIMLIGGQIRPPLYVVYIAPGVLALILSGLATMALARNWLVPKLPHKIGDFYRRFHDGTLGSFGRMRLVFALGILGWLCEVGRLFFVIQALGVSVAIGLIVFVPMANGVLSAIPLTPGGVGVVETGISGLLQLELTVEVAVAVALVDRTISYLSIIVTGGIAFFARQLGGGRKAATGVNTA